MKRTQEKLFADWAQEYKAFFVPRKEFRNSLVRVSTQGLFCPYLQTFVAPFPTRLTAPGSPRMADLATLKHYAVMFKYTPGNLRVFPVWSSVVFSSIYHQFMIKFHLGCSALLHSAHFPSASYNFMDEKKARFTHRASCWNGYVEHRFGTCTYKKFKLWALWHGFWLN